MALGERPAAADDLTWHAPPPTSTTAPKLSYASADRGNAFWRFLTEGEWYASWGYSKQYWAPTDIHVSQPSLGNNFIIHNVRGHDEPGGIFTSDLAVPQFNFRFGRFINDDRTIAIEFNLDHTKYTTDVGQMAYVTGVINGVPVSGNFKLDSSFFLHQLHNGANHVMVNAVYRKPLIGEVNENWSLAGIAKVGAGVMLPHTWNTILGNENNVGPKSFGNLVGIDSGWWRLNGWTAGVEVGLRATLINPVWIEVTNKTAYAYLTNLPAYQGTLNHSLWLNEFVVSLGVTFGGATGTKAVAFSPQYCGELSCLR